MFGERIRAPFDRDAKRTHQRARNQPPHPKVNILNRPPAPRTMPLLLRRNARPAAAASIRKGNS